MYSLLNSQLSARVVALLVAFSVVIFYAFPSTIAQAASISSASDTMSSSTINATSTHVISFVSPSGATANTDTITITFPADFDFTGKATSTLTFTHGATTGLETTETIAAPSDSTWSAAFSGTENRVLTLTPPSDGTGAGAVSPGQKLIITYSGANSVNPSSPGSYAIAIAGNFNDTGDITVNILTNDQVSITATVPQSLTFSISDNTVSFGSLSAVSSRYASGTASGQATEVEAHNLIVGTNAANGYTMTVSGSTLTSGANTISAIGNTNTSPSVGSEQFGLRLNASGGNGAVVTPYSGAGFALNTGGMPDQVATSTSASANTTYSARYLANITSDTEAGSYSSALTYVATANF